MNPLKLLTLLLSIFFLAGCDEDPKPTCQNYEVNLGPFYLEQSSRDLFPYSSTDSNLVFKNQFSEELILSLAFLRKDTTVITYFDQCPFDSLTDVPYVVEREQLLATFINDSLDWSIQFTFRAAYSLPKHTVTGEYDEAEIFFLNLTPGFGSVVSSLIVHKSGQVPSFFNRFHSSITLGSRTFEDVFSTYSIPQNPPRYLIYMNYEFGIVGIEDTAQGQLWVVE